MFFFYFLETKKTGIDSSSIPESIESLYIIISKLKELSFAYAY